MTHLTLIKSEGVSADEKQAAAACGNVHPIFAGLLDSLPQCQEQIARAQYASRLSRMDWEFEHAPSVQWRAGRAELVALRELQLAIDPQAETWNRIAPEHYKVRRSLKVECDLPAGGRHVHWVCSDLNNVEIAQHFMERHGVGTRVCVNPIASPTPEQAPVLEFGGAA